MQPTIVLHGVEIHLESRELIVHGVPKRLPWKAFDILVLLAETPGHVLSKEQLLKFAWGGEVVESSNLTQAVAQIRKAMGEISPGHSYIETVPRVGYRLVAAAASKMDSPKADAQIAEFPIPQEIAPVPVRGRIRKYSIPLLLGAVAIAFALWLLPPWSKHPATANIAEVPFTAFEGDELSSNFSPDGRQIAFAWAKPNGPSHIYLKTLGSESIRPFVTGDGNQTGPAFSPDGRSIAFLRIGRTASTVVVKPLDGGTERSLTTVSNPHVVLIASPGPYVAWTRDGKGLIYSNHGSICLFNIDSRREIQLTQLPQSSAMSDADPALSPDGSTLVFSRPVAIGRADLYRLSLNRKADPVGPPVLLYGNEGWCRSPAWHPDGKHILFTSGDWISPRLYYLDIRSPSSAEPVPNAGADAIQASVSPSGDMVLYTRWFFSRTDS
jgi:DNA-binding winged helix-turn-helix (wHTH) protein/dipeptidyl aminopeptidase/acylaminoacyl peptidase